MGTGLNPPTRLEDRKTVVDRFDEEGSLRRLRIVAGILVLALPIAVAAAITLYRSDLWPIAGGLLLVAVLGSVLLSVYTSRSRQSRSLDILTDRAWSIAEGDFTRSLVDESLAPEFEGLASALEEWKSALYREQNAFEQQRDALSQILDGIGEGLVAINRRKRVVLANRRLADLFGIEGTLIGKSFLELIRSQSLLAAFDRALVGEESTDRATMVVKGMTRQIEMRVFPISTESEIAAVALFIDVTRIEQLERIRRDFIADFSHEVRTPLAGIRSAIETFEAGDLQPSQEDHLKKIIARQVSRLEKLVEEVGELKQIEGGEIQLTLEPVRLHQLLEDLADDFSEGAASRNVRITLSEDDAVALADAQKVQQVFANLIDNALKHGSRGRKVRLEPFREEGVAGARVIDYGDGIPAEEQERIFNRLYRIDRSRSQEMRGTGLGLAITRHLVELHGGRITVRSQPGRGATFEVRLPEWKDER